MLQMLPKQAFLRGVYMVDYRLPFSFYTWLSSSRLLDDRDVREGRAARSRV